MTTSSSPLWDAVELPTFAPLDRDLTVDVAVIGAGLTGITAAFLLKQAGRRVALLDRRAVAGGDTACTTAHATAVMDTDLPALVRSLGRDHAQACWDAGLAAIARIEALVADNGLACDFARVPGFRHVPFDAGAETAASAEAALREEAETAAALGFDVDMLAATPLVGRPGWRIAGQALLHPRKYLKGLLARLSGDGSVVCEHTEAAFGEAPGVLRAGAWTVRAPQVVVATHYPLAGRLGGASAALFQSQLALYTTYALTATIPAPADAEPGLYWDTSEPYRYVRLEPWTDGTMRMIAGGEDHKTGQEPDTDRPLAALERWCLALTPAARITHRWSGQIVQTPDGLPMIGEVAEGQYVATGFSGNGVTFGTLAAMMIGDAIAGRANPWRELFQADRAAVARGPLNYLRENADYPYYRVRDRFAGAETRPLRSLRAGEGAIVDLGDRVVAASRDDRGRIVCVSPTCTHLGCRVVWNGAERTWDCPCHGSRFDASGEVLAGPAAAPLAPM